MNIVKYWYYISFMEYSVVGAQIVWHIILNMWVCNPFYDRTIIRCKICEKQGISVRKVSTVLLYCHRCTNVALALMRTSFLGLLTFH